jgi:outer membrane protein assembly factor BamB
MSTKQKTDGSAQQKPLRLWPGVIIVILQWVVRFGLPALSFNYTSIGVFGGLLCGILLVAWWAFFSRARRLDRWMAILLMIASLLLTYQFVDKSIKTAMMGMMYPVYSIPVLCLAFVAWAVGCHRFSLITRRITMTATILVASGVWAILRTDGMDGEAHQDINWRWAKTAEERLLAQPDKMLSELSVKSTASQTDAEWPGFRGLHRDGVVHGIKINTDWKKSAPLQMWRRSIGPGCSSCAIQGTNLFTQEQRGEFEAVTCYNLNTGEPIWRHNDKARFWDSHAGAGPRSTPTFSQGRIYTLGATGILNVLDAKDGSVIWSHNAANDTKVKIPGWGYCSSPLVVDSIVYIAISGKLIAFDRFNGHHLWSGPDGGESYSSPHLLINHNIKQILFLNNDGCTGFSPSKGKELWKLPFQNCHIVQPAIITESDILIPAGFYNGGIKRLMIKQDSGGWTVKECWKSDKLNPSFNDLVIHKGNAYGFTGPNLVCINISNGELKWRGAPRYGGQLLLLADQDLLLVLTEKGEVALVNASPVQFIELAKFSAIKGKTWNHPVMSGNILVVRNTQEMAAYRL